MLKLTNRLISVAKAAPKCELAVDVGTDHAYIPVYLIQNNIAEKVIATDVAEGPAQRARENIQKYGLSDRISVKTASGLNGISLADVIIIAGMGGKLICNILEESPGIAKTAGLLVLQPMTAVYEVRHFLHQNGYEIICEDLAKEDDKIYNILSVRKGTQRFDDDILYHIGTNHKNPKLLDEYITKKINSLNIAIDNMANSEAASDKRNELVKLREKFTDTL